MCDNLRLATTASKAKTASSCRLFRRLTPFA
jgi:hypothetical protein